MSNTTLDDARDDVAPRLVTRWILPGPAWEVLGQFSVEPTGHGTLSLNLDDLTLEAWLTQANASEARRLTKKLLAYRCTPQTPMTLPAPPDSRARPTMGARRRASPSPRVFAQLHWSETP